MARLRLGVTLVRVRKVMGEALTLAKGKEAGAIVMVARGCGGDELEGLGKGARKQDEGRGKGEKGGGGV